MLRSQLYELELEKRRAASAVVEAGKKKIEWDRKYAAMCSTTVA